MKTELLSTEIPALSLGQMGVSSFFATPIVELSLAGAEQLCAALLAGISELERHVRQSLPRDARGPVPGSCGVVEGPPDLFRRGEAPFASLAMLCTRTVGRVHAEIAGGEAGLHIESRARFRVTYEGGYRPLHKHGGAGWVGIFCVDPGQGDSSPPRTGLLRLHAPSWENTMWQDVLNRRWAGPHALGALDRRPSAGDLLVWPSWVPCEVFPHHGPEPRVDVIFECHVGGAPAGSVS